MLPLLYLFVQRTDFHKNSHMLYPSLYKTLIDPCSPTQPEVLVHFHAAPKQIGSTESKSNLAQYLHVYKIVSKIIPTK